MNNDIKKYQIYAHTRPLLSSDVGYGFVYSDGSINENPENDFFVSILISIDSNLQGYVDIQNDGNIEVLERQEINPYFIEFSFFNSTERIKTNNGSDLTPIMIDKIKGAIFGLSTRPSSYVKAWYDEVGKNSFPWNKGTVNEVTKDDLDELEPMFTNLISKANYYPIEVNK